MLRLKSRVSFTELPFCHCVIFLLLIQSFGGQLQVTGQQQPIVAIVGDDILLPCCLEPTVNAFPMRLEWSRPDLNHGVVHVWQNGWEWPVVKRPSYEGRTSLCYNGMKVGNISLKVTKVKLSDEGTYRCFVPTMKRNCYVQLVVCAVSSPFVAITGLNTTTGGVELRCESKGWYPEPEVLWLDAEGNLLSAGPTETVRGPDDLYTVSSRVTVEKRHGNSFTCRVQQKDINQTRETHIHVPDDFFMNPSCSALYCSITVTVVAAVSGLIFLSWGITKICSRTNRETENVKKGEVKDEKHKVQKPVSHKATENKYEDLPMRMDHVNESEYEDVVLDRGETGEGSNRDEENEYENLPKAQGGATGGGQRGKLMANTSGGGNRREENGHHTVRRSTEQCRTKISCSDQE